MVTPDAHVVALEAATGQSAVEQRHGAEVHADYGATLAPACREGKVIVGVSGGEFGIRGFVDAYDAKTGERAWRFYTVPAKGEPGGETWLGDSWKRGGGATWMTGTYDPKLNTIYWGVGNPGPDLYGEVRKGDNLYTAGLVALDADTGKLKWHFQFTPHDTHDWDACETPDAARPEVEGPRPQGGRAGQSQRLLLCAGSRDRRVPDGAQFRAAELGQGPRRRTAVRF